MKDTEELRQEIKNEDDPTKRAALLVRLGHQLSEKELHVEALETFEKAIATDQSSAISNEAFLRSAVEAYYCADYQKSISYFQNQLPSHLTARTRINTLLIYGDSYARLNLYEDALLVYSQVLTIALEMTDGSERIEVAKMIKVRVDYAIANWGIEPKR